MDKKSQEAFSPSLKTKFTNIKLLAIQILKRVLKHIMQEFEENDGKLLVEDVHHVFVSFIKNCSDFRIMAQILQLVK